MADETVEMNEGAAEPEAAATPESEPTSDAGAQTAAAPDAPPARERHQGAPARRSPSSDKEDDRRDTSQGRPRPRRRRKVSFLSQNKICEVDYKDIAVLKRFTNDEGKILGRRHTGTTAKEQRMIARAIRRAREMALLPFVALDSSSGGGGRGRSRGPYDPGHDRSHGD